MSDKLIGPDSLEAKRNEKCLADLARQALDDSVGSIDEETLRRLRSIRTEAVAQSERADGAASVSRRMWIPATGIAAAVMLGLFLQLQEPTEQNPVMVPNENGGLAAGQGRHQVEESALVVAQSLVNEEGQPWDIEEELLDDMDFYVWLAMKDQMDAANAG